MSAVEVVRTYFEMKTPAELQPAACPDPRARVERIVDCPVSFYRYLYAEVGRAYHWVDRLGWTDEQVRSHLGRSEISVYLMAVAGAPAGYFELCRSGDGSVELAYFGLLPEFLRRGLGKYLLTVAVREAWGQGASRVWLHSCTLDDAAAVPNYVARGFRPVRTETYNADLEGGGSSFGKPPGSLA